MHGLKVNGERMEDLRKAAGIPTGTLAAAAGITRAQYWNIRTGRYSTTPQTLGGLAGALGVSQAELCPALAITEVA